MIPEIVDSNIKSILLLGGDAQKSSGAVQPIERGYTVTVLNIQFQDWNEPVDERVEVMEGNFNDPTTWRLLSGRHWDCVLFDWSTVKFFESSYELLLCILNVTPMMITDTYIYGRLILDKPCVIVGDNLVVNPSQNETKLVDRLRFPQPFYRLYGGGNTQEDVDSLVQTHNLKVFGRYGLCVEMVANEYLYGPPLQAREKPTTYLVVTKPREKISVNEVTSISGGKRDRNLLPSLRNLEGTIYADIYKLYITSKDSSFIIVEKSDNVVLVVELLDYPFVVYFYGLYNSKFQDLTKELNPGPVLKMDTYIQRYHDLTEVNQYELNARVSYIESFLQSRF